jgi:hypothetical protein
VRHQRHDAATAEFCDGVVVTAAHVFRPEQRLIPAGKTDTPGGPLFDKPIKPRLDCAVSDAVPTRLV